MENNAKEHVPNTKNTKTILLGLLLGGLTGAAATLLFTPQSGKRTRTQIRQESIQLRDRATTGKKEAVEQIRSVTNRITAEVQEKAGNLKQLGQDKLVEQMEHVSVALDVGKAAVEAA
ncbi:MAG: YtxH domain-containing protein [Anaerolineales bacterium]|nr:YtxH domain-containing protein [Anaerolineales bacterium]